MSADPTIADVISGSSRWCVVVGDAIDVIAGLAPGSASAIVTDPPYASTGDAASVMSRDGAPREVQFYEAWAREHLAAWFRMLGPAGAAWFTVDWRGAMAFDMAAHKLGIKAPTVGVWDRGGMGMGYVLRKVWEAFVVVQGHEFRRLQTDEVDLWRHEWNPAHRTSTHGAEKPVALMRRAVRLVSSTGDLIIDPFAGSGTTGEAALAEGRRIIMVERDEQFASIARRRCAAASSGRDWKNPQQETMFGVAS